mmetsp:Transcript_86450/g.201127  ORF Transcript_86450/g.201127 Transcript_86450/m.201127 type:complete len:506 (-) Transcript_86450:124-1641(-)
MRTTLAACWASARASTRASGLPALPEAAAVSGNASGPAENGVESAWLYGNMNHYAYYFADLLIGSPTPQQASVIIDTGSRLVGFPCKGCVHCGEHLDPMFDVSLSESARWLNCSSQCSRSCVKGHCSYRETYSEGSTISGLWFDDSVRLGDSFSGNPPVRASLGCHTNENKLFYTQRANGIMGLAPSYRGAHGGRPTFLQDLFRDKAHVDAAIFSICLATWGGRLTVGGYDSSCHIEAEERSRRHCTLSRPCTNDGTTWIDMTASHYYFVFPAGMALAGRTVVASPQAFGVTVVDSGTTYTYFPGPVFRALASALDAYCQEHEGCGALKDASLSTGLPGAGTQCWRLASPAEGPWRFPVLQMQFGRGVAIEWPPHGYLHQRGEPDIWCQTFMENNLFQTVLGISWMIHKDIIFDIANSRLGVAQADCPEHRKNTNPAGEATLSGKLAWKEQDMRARRQPMWPLAVGALLAVATGAGAAAACWSSDSAHRELAAVGRGAARRRGRY